MDLPRSRRARGSAAVSDPWLARFGPEPPQLAGVLLEGVRAALAGTGPLPELRAGAEALGVLRAQEGHAVAGLVEDLAALRPPPPLADPDGVVDAALAWAVAAYVDELTAILETRATRDPLTGLPNRAAFDEALRHEVAAATRTAPPSLLLVDLDRFKAVNDSDGHLAGDAVLVGVAGVLTASLRATDLACRVGGDEFAVILPRTTPRRATQVARRLLAAARTAPALSSASARVTFSLGLGWLARPGDVEELVAVADGALYRVKAAGGDDLAVSASDGDQ